MALWQKFLVFINILSSTYLGAMQFIENDSFGESFYAKMFANFTASNKPALSIVCGILTGGLSSLIIILQPYLTQKKFRDSLMDGIFEQVLDNDKTKSRITLFRDAGLFISWYYRLLDFVGLWKRGWKTKSIIRYCWTAKYIKILKRWGTDHKKSHTHFYFSTETADICQGIAGRVRQQEVGVVKALPRLDGIDLNTVDETHPVVAEYMNKGFISDFNVLKSINKLAPFIHANFISASGGKRKLVLVIDSWAEKNPFSLKQKQNLLSTYVKQISASFGE